MREHIAHLHLLRMAESGKRKASRVADDACVLALVDHRHRHVTVRQRPAPNILTGCIGVLRSGRWVPSGGGPVTPADAELDAFHRDLQVSVVVVEQKRKLRLPRPPHRQILAAAGDGAGVPCELVVACVMIMPSHRNVQLHVSIEWQRSLAN